VFWRYIESSLLQKDNVANQREHIILLLSSAHSRLVSLDQGRDSDGNKVFFFPANLFFRFYWVRFYCLTESIIQIKQRWKLWNFDMCSYHSFKDSTVYSVKDGLAVFNVLTSYLFLNPCSKTSLNPDKAVSNVHERILENYVRWCHFLRREPQNKRWDSAVSTCLVDWFGN